MIWAENLNQRTLGSSPIEGDARLMEAQYCKKVSEHLLVSIIDDDESVRESLPDLVRELGFPSRAFSSAEEFLSSDCDDETSCLILDIMMPGMSGPELQEELKRRRRHIPIIFITAQTSDTLSAQMLARGAVECLIKPFRDTALLDALESALRTS